MKLIQILIFLLIAAPTFAESNKSVELPSPAGSLVSVVLALVFVVVVILLCAWFLRRLQNGAFRSNACLKVVHQQMVGAKERLMVVEVDNKQLLLGVTAYQITPLAELSEDWNKNSLVQNESAPNNFQSLFARQLKASLGIKPVSSDQDGKSS